MVLDQQSRPGSSHGQLQSLCLLATFLLGSALVTYWQHQVNLIVPNPYLDEVFHVRQAQAYWSHQWRQWDPKITTPPGLYLSSYLTGLVLALMCRRSAEPSASDLRSLNSVVLFNLLPFRLRKLLSYIRNSTHQPRYLLGEQVAWVERGTWELNLTVLNTCLFPPVFFFSGLYYTDLAALLIVLEVYICDLWRCRNGNGRIETVQRTKLTSYVTRQLSFSNLNFLIYGLLALLFRQTNIFWVSLFMGGLQIVRTLHSLTVDCESRDFAGIARASWDLRQLYDPPVSEASFEDYLKTMMSLAITTLANINGVIRALIPYFVFVAAFGIFVVWNGGVVLGHKEFHSASLHLSQMLYIWPYFMFFSWPILVIPRAVKFTGLLVPKTANIVSLMQTIPRIRVIFVFISLLLVTVHFNTIVHPFTLADNRHYVFYIFRILLRHPAIKYLATPIYFGCGWAVLTAFGQPYTIEPYAHLAKTQTFPSAINPNPASRTKTKSPSSHHSQLPQVPKAKVSLVLVWLACTALSLIPATLVEPRYFIIPWVMWRLHIPPSDPSTNSRSVEQDENPAGAEGSGFITNLPLLMESIWFILINVVTGYTFLYRGFGWPQEPGVVQRFLW